MYLPSLIKLLLETVSHVLKFNGVVNVELVALKEDGAAWPVCSSHSSNGPSFLLELTNEQNSGSKFLFMKHI